jgi:hypothetical protein
VARHIPTPRKQRTRQHVIADQSLNYPERYVIDEGHTVGRVQHDYGYDFYLATYDEEGYIEPDTISIQLKAAETLELSGEDYLFDVDVKDYNLWVSELLPVVLVLFDASRRKAYWLLIQDYFREDPSRRPQEGATTVRVRVPQRQAVNRRAVRRWRARKQEIQDHLGGLRDHV